MKTIELTAVRTGPGEKFYDLGTLKNGVLELEYSGDGEISAVYGSYPDFMPFSAKLTGRGRLVSSILTLRYFRIEGDVACVGKVSFSDWMKPLAERGRFVTDDPLFNEICRISNHTVHCCVLPHECGNSTIHLQPQRSRDFVRSWKGVHDNYVLFDGARRDREVWVGDLFYEVRALLCGFGDCETVRNSFDVILCQMREDGYIPGSSISMLNFPDYTAWFFVVLADYYMMSGDRDYLAANETRLRRVLSYLLSSLDDGLLKLERGQTWAWTLARRGYITSSNCILYRALLSAKQIFDALEPSASDAEEKSVDSVRSADSAEELSERLDRLALRIKTRLNAETFDEAAGAYRDSVGAENFSLDANVLAVLFGVCEPKNRIRVLDFVKAKFGTEHGSLACWPKEAPSAINHNHNNNVWPFVNCFEIEARFLCGQTREAEGLLRKVYGGMIERGADTFWEFFDGKTGDFVRERMEQVDDDRDNYDSECHGWSAGPTSILLTYGAGLKPLKPGFETCELNPDFLDFHRIDAALPTAFGEIEVNLERTDGCAMLRLRLPEGVTAVWKGRGTLSAAVVESSNPNGLGRFVEENESVASGDYYMDASYFAAKEAEAI